MKKVRILIMTVFVIILAGCAASMAIPNFSRPIGLFAEVCQTDRLINFPYNAEMASGLYVGRKLPVFGMYEKNGITFYLVSLQDSAGTCVIFSEPTGRLEPEIYVYDGGMKILPTLQPNNVIFKLNGCKQ